MHVWMPKDSLQGLVLSFHYVGPGDLTHVLGLEPYPPSHPVVPEAEISTALVSLSISAGTQGQLKLLSDIFWPGGQICPSRSRAT